MEQWAGSVAGRLLRWVKARSGREGWSPQGVEVGGGGEAPCIDICGESVLCLI